MGPYQITQDHPDHPTPPTETIIIEGGVTSTVSSKKPSSTLTSTTTTRLKNVLTPPITPKPSSPNELESGSKGMESSRPNSLTADLSVEKDGHGSDSDSDEDEEGEEGSEGQEETHSTASKSSSRRKKFQDPKPYKCLHPGCGAAYKKPSKLAIHELTHSGERPFRCTFPGCDKAYTRADHLSRHARTHGDTETERKPFKCAFENCTAAFSTNYKLRRHVQIHETPKPFVCTFPGCEERFTKHSLLRRHEAAHVGKLPFVCDHDGCDKSFPSSHKLKLHLLTHQENRYQCGLDDGKCTFTCAKWSDLQAHIKQVHPVKCKICSKTFTTREGLKNHISKIHNPATKSVSTRLLAKTELAEFITPDTPASVLSELLPPGAVCFPCTWNGCNKILSSKKILDVHIKTTHLKHKPFACDVCDSRFGHKHLLVRHKRIHDREQQESGEPEEPSNEVNIRELTGLEYEERQIPCSVDGCLYRFTRVYDLERHLKKIHPEIVQEDDEDEVMEEVEEVDEEENQDVEGEGEEEEM